MQIKILTDKDRVAFNKLAFHPIQSWEWGEFRQENGNTVVRVGKFVGKQLIEGHQLTVHKLPKTNYKAAMLLKGPLPSKEVLEYLKIFAKEEKILFIRLEPNVTHNLTEARIFLKKEGAVPGRRFFTPETFVIDLTKTDEELLKSFHPKTRYNIKVAIRHRVMVSECTKDKDFEKYLELTEKTAKRQGFFAHTPRYHKLMWKHLKQAGIAHLLTAKYQNETLVSWILFVWKDTLYYPYGASSDLHKNVMAANLQMWEAIRFGKKLGLKSFDLWGKETGVGFTRFKEGYSPEVVEFIGTWDFVINSTLYHIYRVLESIRWKILKLFR